MARRKRTLRGWRVPARGKCEVFPTATMADVKACARQCDSHWFERGSMRFFNSRVGSRAYADNKGGAYFVSSEQFDHNSPRLFSVRHYDPTRCAIDTIGKFQGHTSGAAAATVAKRLAKTGGLGRSRRRR